MPAGSTYTPIATTTLGSAQATVSFNSIAGTYTDLVLVTDFSVTSAGDFYLRFNSDTGSNYSVTIMVGDGTSAVSSRSSSTTYISPNYNSDQTSQRAIHNWSIQNYANTTTNKTALCRYNNASRQTVAAVGLWRSTSAITSITIARSAGNFDTGSTFTLYGIASA
jgi:hypothetical protein